MVFWADFSKFFYNFAIIARLLTELTKKNVISEIADGQLKAEQDGKFKLIEAILGTKFYEKFTLRCGVWCLVQLEKRCRIVGGSEDVFLDLSVWYER